MQIRLSRHGVQLNLVTENEPGLNSRDDGSSIAAARCIRRTVHLRRQGWLIWVIAILDASDADLSVYQHIAASWEELSALARRGLQVTSTAGSPEQVVRRALVVLREKGLR